MSGPRDESSAGWVDTAFEEWLEQVAADQDMSQQELLHRMMASYWVLTEFEDIVDDPDDDTLAAELGHDTIPDFDTTPTTDTDTPTPNPDTPETLTDFVETFATYLDTSQHTDTTKTTNDRQDTPQQEHDAASHAHVDALADRLDTLETTIETLTTNQEDLATDHDDLATRVDADLETTERVLEYLVDQHEALADRLDILQGEVDADISRLADRHDALAADLDELAERFDTHQDRVDDDFDTTERILERLTDKYGQTDETLDQVETTLLSLLEDHRRVKRARTRLADLLTAAHDVGVHEGECQGCGHNIDLGLLATPTCPNCNTPLVDVQSGGWFRSNTIITGSRRDAVGRAITPENAEDRRPHDATESPLDGPATASDQNAGTVPDVVQDLRDRTNDESTADDESTTDDEFTWGTR